ncbi:hypothetical protein GCM10010449_67550 [Streptomyces rectiviolaceus]|uniref:Uncharacterized protein n=1 Tax=Streptomyces rectiviolaceus TaxID=332591 RepID=A0ABP6N8F3_9ACTN
MSGRGGRHGKAEGEGYGADEGRQRTAKAHGATPAEDVVLTHRLAHRLVHTESATAITLRDHAVRVRRSHG